MSFYFFDTDPALIYVLSALGFLPGKEVKAEKVGNLGLQDRGCTTLFLDVFDSCSCGFQNALA
jgi:hypothetical protein